MSETASPLLDSIPMVPMNVEIALTVDNLSRLLHRRTDLRRDACRDIAISAVFGALSDAKGHHAHA